eukprot:g41480.t1
MCAVLVFTPWNVNNLADNLDKYATTVTNFISNKTKELIIDFRKKGGGHALICINGAEMERFESVKFREVTITNNLSWTSPTE